MLKCEQCGREFKNELALKIHIGRQHGSKAKAKKAAKKAQPTKASPLASTTCRLCGRSFGMPAYLARHMAACHGRGRTATPAERSIPARASARTKAAADKEMAARDALTCRICGRSFGMPVHLARHMAASHGRRSA